MRRLLACVALVLVLVLVAPLVHASAFEGSGLPYKTLESGHFLVRYEEGDERAAEDVMKALEDSYENITVELGLVPRSKTIVELYVSPQLYNSFKKRANWSVGGKVDTKKNMILLPSPSVWGVANNLFRYKHLWNAMPHEFVHIVLGSYRGPIWFDEGIAAHKSGWSDHYHRILRGAVENDSLISLQELEDYNIFMGNSSLSYAEGYSAVAYIRSAHGEDGIRRLIDGAASDLGFDGTLAVVTGKDRDGFEAGWKAYVEDTWGPKPQRADPQVKSGDRRAGKVRHTVGEDLASGETTTYMVEPLRQRGGKEDGLVLLMKASLLLLPSGFVFHRLSAPFF